MLLKKVERSIRTRLSTIVKRIQKLELCDLPYKVDVGKIGLKEDRYLVTGYEVVINGKPFTTFAGHRVYNPYTGKEERYLKNALFKVPCKGVEVVIGFVNVHNYLHLPDYLTAQLLKQSHGGVTAVSPKVVLSFGDGTVKVFEHTVDVSIPYYLYNFSFTYTPLADLLAKIIGLVDDYKRGLFAKSTVDKYIYFLYPYVSLALYRRLRTTLYPSFMSTLVSEVYEAVKADVEKELSPFVNTTDEERLNLIEGFIEEYNERSDEESIVEVFFNS